MRAIAAREVRVCLGGQCVDHWKARFVAMRGQNGHRPRVFHSFQDKEPVRQVGLYGGTPGLFGHLRGRNINDYS